MYEDYLNEVSSLPSLRDIAVEHLLRSQREKAQDHVWKVWLSNSQLFTKNSIKTMETLQIEKSKALQAHVNAGNKGKRLLEGLFGKEVFEKKPAIERIKTIEDAFTDQGLDMVKELAWLDDYKNAERCLEVIAAALRDGNELDFENLDQYKYYPWFRRSSGGGFSYDDYDYTYSGANVGARLCVDTEEKAVYFGKQFLSIWKTYCNGK